MTTKQTKHLAKIVQSFAVDCSKKYERGAEEHGGNLWDKKGLVDMALEEVIDLYVYLKTLQTQIKTNKLYKVTGVDKK